MHVPHVPEARINSSVLHDASPFRTRLRSTHSRSRHHPSGSWNVPRLLIPGMCATRYVYCVFSNQSATLLIATCTIGVIAMHVREVYTAAIGSLFVVFLGWQLAVIGDVLRRRGVRLFRKVFIQTLLLTRRRGSSNYSIGAGFILASLCAGNIVALCVQVDSAGDIANRLRGLLHVNLIPLFLSVRTPLLSELFLGLTFQPHSLLHRLLGWVCVAEGLGYTVLSLFVRQWSILSMEFGVRNDVLGP